VSEIEVSEVAVIISRLSDLGIVVTVVGDRVHFLGRHDDLYAESGMATIAHRVGAVREALARGPGFGEKIVRERDAASAAIRRGRVPRASHQRKPAPGDVPTNKVSAPAAAVASREGDGKPVGSLLPPRPPPSAPAFLDRETR
jgi:hypothetical protein